MSELKAFGVMLFALGCVVVLGYCCSSCGAMVEEIYRSPEGVRVFQSNDQTFSGDDTREVKQFLRDLSPYTQAVLHRVGDEFGFRDPMELADGVIVRLFVGGLGADRLGDWALPNHMNLLVGRGVLLQTYGHELMRTVAVRKVGYAAAQQDSRDWSGPMGHLWTIAEDEAQLFLVGDKWQY